MRYVNSKWATKWATKWVSLSLLTPCPSAPVGLPIFCQWRRIVVPSL